MRERLEEWWKAKRSWRVRVHAYAGPWLSLGVHLDLAPQVDIHFGWLLISLGRLRDCEVSGFQFPPNPRAVVERLRRERDEARDAANMNCAQKHTALDRAETAETEVERLKSLLPHLVDVVWGTANEDESVPSSDWARCMIEQAELKVGD